MGFHRQQRSSDRALRWPGTSLSGVVLTSVASAVDGALVGDGLRFGGGALRCECDAELADSGSPSGDERSA